MKKKRGSRGALPKPATDRTGRWVWLGIVVLVTLPAIFIARQAQESFRLPKLLLSDTLALATLWLLAWRLRAAGRIDLRRVLRQPAVLAAVPLLAVATLGLATSDHPFHVRQALVSLWIGLACLVGWSLALTDREKRQVLTALLVPAAILAWIAIGQEHGFFETAALVRQTLASLWVVAAGGVAWYLGPERRRGPAVALLLAAGSASFLVFGANPDLFEIFHFEGELKERITLTSLAGGAFDLAAYLALPLLVGQVAWYRETRPGRRWAWGLLVASMLYAVLLTQTMTAIAAAILASFVLWLLLLPGRRVAAVAAVAVVIGIGLTAAVGPLRERLVGKAASLFAGDLNQVLTGRLDGWRAAGWMFREQPVAGVGHGAYRARFGTARLALVEDGVEFYGRQHQPYFSNAHSEILEALAEWGLLGMLALAWAVALLVRRLLPRSREPEGDGDDGRARRALAWAGLTALAVLSAANFPLRIALVAYPWVLFLSWIFGGYRAPVRGSEPEQPGRQTVDGRWLFGVLLAVLSIALLLQGRQASRRWQASHQLAEVEQKTLAMWQRGLLRVRPMPAEVRRELEGYVDKLHRAAAMDPVEVGIPNARGSIYYVLERPEAAIRAYQEALRLEERAETYANLGRACLMAGDRDASREAFRTALRLNRDIATRHRSYLRELGLAGRGRGARQQDAR